jgi:hypothetical protein
MDNYWITDTTFNSDYFTYIYVEIGNVIQIKH